ncbi:MAG: FxLYD domain-containing protein [Phycisphaerae bacterium]|jgi:hypothetical protein|nr:FxLYD domain-containing protein [Phycisphaerae bacterium]MDP7288973.1 FxLYD domain-containing protein [Phycisphaerae bacterium]
MNAAKSVLIAALTSVALTVGCGELDRNAAPKSSGTGATFQGGSANQAAQAYARNVQLQLTALRTSDDKVTVSGMVVNDGSRTVTLLKVRIALLGEKGKEIAECTELLAENRLFGGRAPIGPASANQVSCTIDNSDWASGKITTSVVEIAIK